MKDDEGNDIPGTARNAMPALPAREGRKLVEASAAKRCWFNSMAEGIAKKDFHPSNFLTEDYNIEDLEEETENWNDFI